MPRAARGKRRGARNPTFCDGNVAETLPTRFALAHEFALSLCRRRRELRRRKCTDNSISVTSPSCRSLSGPLRPPPHLHPPLSPLSLSAMKQEAREKRKKRGGRATNFLTKYVNCERQRISLSLASLVVPSAVRESFTRSTRTAMFSRSEQVVNFLRCERLETNRDPATD